jgi:hypothetical protein
MFWLSYSRVSLGIVPSSTDAEGETDPFDILAVHEDGRVRRLSSEMTGALEPLLPISSTKHLI